MSVSSGRFSFPSTGIYRITVQHDWYQPSGSDRAIQMSVRFRIQISQEIVLKKYIPMEVQVV